MPNFALLYRELEKMKRKDTSVSELQGIVQRIKQPIVQGNNIQSRVEDALYKRGIGSGSPATQVLNSKAEARAELISYVNKPNNVKAFQSLPAEQKAGIMSMLKGN